MRKKLKFLRFWTSLIFHSQHLQQHLHIVHRPPSPMRAQCHHLLLELHLCSSRLPRQLSAHRFADFRMFDNLRGRFRAMFARVWARLSDGCGTRHDLWIDLFQFFHNTNFFRFCLNGFYVWFESMSQSTDGATTKTWHHGFYRRKHNRYFTLAGFYACP